MISFTKVTARHSSKKKATVAKGLESSFSSIFFDLYLFPNTLKLPSLPPAGREGLLEDARNIRGYFRSGAGEFFDVRGKTAR